MQIRRVTSFILLATVLTMVVSAPLQASSKSCTQALIPEALSSSRPFEEPSLAEMRKHLMGVHVTNFLPQGGYLRSTIQKGMGFRPTVHFALGQMVVSHESGGWESSKYAVLVPFRNLEKQLVNVFHQDTFILGDLRLTKGSILIVGEGEPVPATDGIEVIRYNPAAQSLRSRIEQVLKDRSQWLFDAKGGHEYDPVFYNGQKLNQKNFFNAVHARYPHVTFGLHHTHPTGRIDHFIHDNFGIFRDPKSAYKRSYLKWILQLEILQIYIRQTDKIASTVQNRANIHRTYQSAKEKFESRLNIIKAEIALQKKFQKTFLGTEGLTAEFIQKAKDLANDPAALSKYLEDNAGIFEAMELNLEKVSSELFIGSDMRFIREHLTETQLTVLLEKHPEIADILQGKDFQIGTRIIESSTATVQEKQRASTKLLINANARQANYLIQVILYQKLGLEIRKIFTHAEVAANLGQFYDLRAFTHLKSDKPGELVWFARELRKTKDKAKWWADGIRNYGFEEIAP